MEQHNHEARVKGRSWGHLLLLIFSLVLYIAAMLMAPLPVIALLVASTCLAIVASIIERENNTDCCK